jgi:hypothetical protein
MESALEPEKTPSFLSENSQPSARQATRKERLLRLKEMLGQAQENLFSEMEQMNDEAFSLVESVVFHLQSLMQSDMKDAEQVVKDLVEKAPNEITKVLKLVGIKQIPTTKKKKAPRKTKKVLFLEPEVEDLSTLRIEKKLYPLGELLFYRKSKKIILPQDFFGQKKKLFFWDNVGESRWIESLLLDFPPPTIWFEVRKNDDWFMYDGYKRLNACFRFMEENAYSLKGLEFFPEYEGKLYTDLPRSIQRRLLEGRWQACLIEKGTDIHLQYALLRRLQSSKMTEQDCKEFLVGGALTPFLDQLEEVVEKEGLWEVLPVKNHSRGEFNQLLLQAIDSSSENSELYKMQKAASLSSWDLENILQRVFNEMRSQKKIKKEKDARKRKQEQESAILGVAATVGGVALLGAVIAALTKE